MADIVIIGGGVIGSSIAYHLALAGRAADVQVIEPDPTYAWAATPRAVGTVRHVHGTPENVLMSKYGHAFYSDFATRMAVNGEPAGMEFRKGGYTFMVWGKDAVAHAEANWKMQTSLGAAVELADQARLKQVFPLLNAEDVDAALYSPNDGWIDPHAALMGFRRKARSLGVEYVEDRVIGLETQGKRVTQVVLQSGAKLAPKIVVNCANCWAPDICAMVGMKVPISVMRRQTFYFEVRETLHPFGVTRDLNGLSFRTEGAGYVVGLTRLNEPRGFNWDVDHDWFDDAIWPKLAERVQAFEALKVLRSWSGHYDQNEMDSQPILGPWVGGLENFHIAAGFSGHGLQHAPAVGRGMAELLVEGRYTSIDLTKFSYQRVIDNAPIVEHGPPA